MGIDSLTKSPYSTKVLVGGTLSFATLAYFAFTFFDLMETEATYRRGLDPRKIHDQRVALVFKSKNYSGFNIDKDLADILKKVHIQPLYYTVESPLDIVRNINDANSTNVILSCWIKAEPHFFKPGDTTLLVNALNEIKDAVVLEYEDTEFTHSIANQLKHARVYTYKQPTNKHIQVSILMGNPLVIRFHDTKKLEDLTKIFLSKGV
jgi:hypothetical protein